MVSGGGQSSSGSGSTGQTSSLSFVPALLGSAFFGSGIGLEDGGFTLTGTGDFRPSGRIKGSKASSLVDPVGLDQILNRSSLQGFGGLIRGNSTSGGKGGGSGGQTGGLLGDRFAGTGVRLPEDFGGGTGAGLGGFLNNVFGVPPNFKDLAGKSALNLGLFGEGGPGEVGSLLETSSGPLNPFDLVSNLTDLVNPGVNPAIGSALNSLLASDVGALVGNDLLFGGIGPALKEGLKTGFKPDLQPVIDEASRRFFGDIVPALGQQNVALQEGVGPFSTDLQGNLLTAGADLASTLGALEVENQNLAADRIGELLGLSGLVTDQLFNAPTNAARNSLDLGEQLALTGTVGGRQATLLQLLSGIQPAGPIQASSSQNSSKGGQGGILA